MLGLRKIMILWIALIAWVGAWAQTADNAILDYQTFIGNVFTQHPVAKKANLAMQKAAATLLDAKGNFDPIIEANWAQKNLNDKLYYRYLDAQITLPTPVGIDVVGGYQNTKGLYLNPESNTQKYGLWHWGLEANLLQGLLTDQRRTDLKQAKVFETMAQNQQQIMLNQLLYDASMAYLEWQKYFFIQQTITQNLQLANTYLNNTKQLFANGEKTRVDTLEAFIILQDGKTFLQANLANVIQAQQNLENYLWFENQPLALQINTQPQNYTQKIIQENAAIDVQNLLENHPQIIEKQNKQAIYELDRIWKKDKLKPKLKLKYNPLVSSTNQNALPNLAIDNYKLGLSFSASLMLRKQRADLAQTQIKIEELGYEITDKKNELQNKIQSSLAELNALQMQLNLQQQNVQGYQQLLDAENQQFNFGESSVFLINKRQEKYLDGQIKLIELHNKYQQKLLAIAYYTNTLN